MIMMTSNHSKAMLPRNHRPAKMIAHLETSMTIKILVNILLLAKSISQPDTVDAGFLNSERDLTTDGRLSDWLLPERTPDSTTSSGDLSIEDYRRQPCQLVPVTHVLHQVGCVAKAIDSFACVGLCSSYVQVSPSRFWERERSCSCCQQTGLKEATFSLDCPSLNPPYRKVIITALFYYGGDDYCSYRIE